MREQERLGNIMKKNRLLEESRESNRRMARAIAESDKKARRIK